MKKIALLGLVLLSVFIMPAAEIQAEQKYVFGVHPFQSPVKLKTMFTPLIEYLSQELGAEIEFRSARDYDSAMELLLDGKVQFSFAGPAMFAILDEQHPGKIKIGAAVVNADGTPTFKGVIVARENSPFTSLADLRGKKIAFGDRESTLSAYMPAYMLIREGIFDSVTYNFVGSHDNVAKGVINGLFDAGGMKPDVAMQYVGKGLKIIATSDPVYEHLIIMGPSVEPDVVERVQKALLNVKDPNVYKSINSSVTGFAVVEAGDYDNLKEIIREVDARMPK